MTPEQLARKGTPRRRHFVSLVEEDVAYAAGFNWGVRSLFIPGDLTVYLGTRLPWGEGLEGEPTIVVVERRIRRRDGWERTEWHVGTIGGPPLGERDEEQVEKFLSEVEAIGTARRTSVAGKDLQRAITQTYEKLHAPRLDS